MQNLYEQIIATENLYSAFYEFRRGKRFKPGVPEFEYNLEKNIYELHTELKNCSYLPLESQIFLVSSPKPRFIEAAQVKDRVLHHALCRIIEPIFESRFIYHSFACRKNKGTHKAVQYLEQFWQQVSQNYTQKIYFLKCDIAKYFPSIDLKILKKIIWKQIKCPKTRDLISIILDTQYINDNIVLREKGLPIGNLTSQLFANVYLNELDLYMKHELKIKHYLRYMDDFICVSSDRNVLVALIPKFEVFLQEKLNLCLHPVKRQIYSSKSGIDFVGYFLKSKYKIIRQSNIKRFIKRINLYKKTAQFKKIVLSILAWKGYAMQANSYKLCLQILSKLIKG